MRNKCKVAGKKKSKVMARERMRRYVEVDLGTSNLFKG